MAEREEAERCAKGSARACSLGDRRPRDQRLPWMETTSAKSAKHCIPICIVWYGHALLNGNAIPTLLAKFSPTYAGGTRLYGIYLPSIAIPLPSADILRPAGYVYAIPAM